MTAEGKSLDLSQEKKRDDMTAEGKSLDLNQEKKRDGMTANQEIVI